MPDYRIAVLSDIHASQTTLAAVLDAIELFSPLDGILVAGDFTYGPNQPATITRLYERGVTAIRGNGDVNLLDFADGKSPDFTHTLNQFSLIRWSLDHTTSETLKFLRSLPEQRVVAFPGADPIRLVHGSPRNINESLDPEKHPGRLETVLNTCAEPLFVFGHTHRALKRMIDGRLVVNPGAVSMAVGQPTTAHFSILEWSDSSQHWKAHLHQTPYESSKLIREFSESGLLDVHPFGRLLLDAALTGKDVAGPYMLRIKEMANASGCGDLPYIPDAIWEQAQKTAFEFFDEVIQKDQ